MSLSQLSGLRPPSGSKRDEISKEAIKKIHEEIFGSDLSFDTESTDVVPTPRTRSPRISFPAPLFPIKKCSKTSVSLKRPSPNSGFGFILRKDKFDHTKIYAEPGSTGFSSGLIPGDVLLSVLGSNAKEHSLEQLVSLINSSTAEYLNLDVEPSNETLEFSSRCIPISPDLSFITEQLDQIVDPHLRTELESIVVHLGGAASNCINVRNWIKTRGTFDMLSTMLSKFYSMAISQKMTNVASRKPNEVYIGDRVLFSHREGYSLGSVSEVLSPNRFRLRLDATNQVVDALLDEINLANPEALDGLEDLLLLEHINESTFVYNLHSRFLSSLPYTYCADLALVAINPMRELNIYADSLKQLFFDCHDRLDMPPHIYSVAQTALARLEAVFYLRQHYGAKSASEPLIGQSETVSGGTVLTCSMYCQSAGALKIPTQAICLLGRSGAGKSISTEHILEYCICRATSAGPVDTLTAPKVRAVCCLLDAFTCSRTLLNTNASRSMRLFTIELTPSCSPTSPSSPSPILLRPTRLQVDLFLLDKFRVTRRPEGEPTFHIFYYFLAGLQEDLRRDFMLEDLSSPNLFMTPLQRAEDKALAKAHWEAIRKAANLLGARFENEFLQGVCRLLAVIYHLGCAGAIPATTASDNGEDTVRPRASSRALGFINFSAAERAASLLGCSLEALSSAIFEAPTGSRRCQELSSLELLSGFVANLYAIAANSLKDLINSSLAPAQTRSKSVVEATMRTNTARLLVLDPPGLQCPESGGRASGGSFEDLLYNYANECLLQLYQKGHDTEKPITITTTTDEMVSFLDNSNSTSPSAVSVAMAAANVAGGGQPGLEAGQTSFAAEFVRRSLSPESPTRHAATLGQGGRLYGPFVALDSATCSGNLQAYLRLVTQKYHEHKLRYSDRGTSLPPHHLPPGNPHTLLPACVVYSSDEIGNVYSPILRGFGDSMDEGASASTLSASSSSGLAATFISDVKYVIGLLQSCSLSLPASSAANTPASLCGVRSDLHWVHCLLPVANAGLCQVVGAAAATQSQLANGAAARRFCVPLVRSQVRGIMLSPDLISRKPEVCQRFLTLLRLPRPSFYPLPDISFSVTQEPVQKPPPVSPVATTALTNGGTVQSRPNVISVSKRESPLPLPPAEVVPVAPSATVTKATFQATSGSAHYTVDSGNGDEEAGDGDDDGATTFLSSQIETDPVSPQLRPPQVIPAEVTNKAPSGADTERDAPPASSSPRGAVLSLPLSELKVSTSSDGPLTNGSLQLASDNTKLDAAISTSATLARSPSSSASTFNFIYGPAGREFPWDQFLSLPPADRGLIKQLRIQLEELEESREALLRKQRLLQTELEETQQTLHEQQRERQHAEARCLATQRQNSELASRVEELEENLEDMAARQRRSVIGASASSPALSAYVEELSQATEERNNLRQEVADLQERLKAAANERAGAMDVEIIYLKSRIRELEGRMELEASGKNRLQSTVDRLKEQLEQLSSERDRLITSLQAEKENNRQLMRSLRETREDKERLERKLTDCDRQRQESVSEVAACMQEKLRLQEELSQALRRRHSIRKMVSRSLRRNSTDSSEDDFVESHLSSCSGQSRSGIFSPNGSEAGSFLLGSARQSGEFHS
ncbi:hypothetical protein AAHC03_04571 [Spirometra sp. Aus1]